MRSSATVLAVVAIAVIALSGACNKPKAGGKCEVAQALCEDGTTVLACQGGVFIEARCRGPAGCAKTGARVTCDDSVADVNEACLETASENRACASDKKASLRCDHGTFRVTQMCRGPKGCQISGDAVSCDTKVAEKGDLCTLAGAIACTTDLKSRVVCKDGKFVFDRNCRGPTGCHAADMACDESVSDLGDPCGVPNMPACSPDGETLLTCQGGQFTKDRPCKKTGCHALPSGKIECL